MGARVYYDGYGITELRRWARELLIKGRTRMGGNELLVVCRAENDRQVVAREKALIAKMNMIKPGQLLRFREHPGCVIIVRSHVRNQESVGRLPVRYVRAEYVSLCENCAAGRDPLDVRLANEDATGKYSGAPHRFFLNALEPVPCGRVAIEGQPCGDVAEVIAGNEPRCARHGAPARGLYGQVDTVRERIGAVAADLAFRGITWKLMTRELSNGDAWCSAQREVGTDALAVALVTGATWWRGGNALAQDATWPVTTLFVAHSHQRDGDADTIVQAFRAQGFAARWNGKPTSAVVVHLPVAG